MSSLVAQPCFSVRLCDSVCVCVFYNWLRLLHNPVDTGSPFTPPLPLGTVKSCQQRPSWTRPQTNAKVRKVVFLLRSLFLLNVIAEKRADLRRHATKKKTCESAAKHAVTQQLCSCLRVIRAGQETDSQAAWRCLPAQCYFKPPSSVTAVGGSSKEVARTPPLPAWLTAPAFVQLPFFRSLVSPNGTQRFSAVLRGGLGRERESERLVTLPLDYTDAW